MLAAHPARIRALTFAILMVAACGGADDDIAVDREEISMPPILASTRVGTMSGAFSVGLEGSANYSLPLEVPPGRAGVQPALSLDYSSRAGRGLLGPGWSVSTGSQIAPCSTSWRRDGVVRPVQLLGADQLCLDGAPLVVCTVGPCSASGNEYRTEPDSTAKIVASKDGSGNTTSWTVYAKDGRIVKYGDTSDSRIQALVTTRTGDATCQAVPRTLAWLQSRVEDRVGNYMTYKYSFVPGSLSPHSFCPEAPGAPPQAQLEWVLENIKYTGSTKAGKSPNRTVQFNYIPATEPQTRYVRGIAIRTTQRLKSIQMLAPTTDGGTTLSQVRRYLLRYEDEPQPQPGKRSRLASVELCDLADLCLPPTKFTYSDATPSFGQPDVSPISVADPEMFFTTDVNGDGRDDLVYMDGNTDQVGVRCGTATGLAAVQYSFYPEHDTDEGTLTRLVPYDKNGDGRTDLIGTYEQEFCCDGAHQPTDCEGPGPVWACTERKTRVFLASATSPTFGAGSVTSEVHTLADGDGDLAADDFELSPPGPWPSSNDPPWDQTWRMDGTLLSHSPAWSAFARCGTEDTCETVRPELAKVRDIDGDGLAELLLPYHKSSQLLAYDILQVRGSTVEALRSNLDSVATRTFDSSLGRLVSDDPGMNCSVFADVNADGLADQVSLGYGGALRMNHGHGSFGPWVTGVAPGFNGLYGCTKHEIGAKEVQVVDYNQDGLSDLLVLGTTLSYLGTEAARVLETVRTPGGYGFVTRTLPFTVTTRFEWLWEAKTKAPLDVNGDGLFDVLQVRTGGDNPECALGTTCLELYTQEGGYADRLTRMDDGMGALVRSVKYAPLASTGYTLPTGCVYPERCLGPNQLVVTEERVPDATSTPTAPTSGTEVLARTYEYADGRADSWGSWATFRTVTVTDVRTGARQRKTFDMTPVVVAGAQCAAGPYPTNICRYPFAGQSIEDLNWAPIKNDNGGVLAMKASRVLTEYAVRSWPSTAPQFYFSYPRVVKAEDYELPASWTPAAGLDPLGTALVSSVTTETSVDDFNNATSVIVGRGRASAITTTSTARTNIVNDTANWLIGLVGVEDTTSSQGSLQATRTTRYVYESDLTGRVRDVVSGPAAVGSRRCTRIAARDVFGNPTRIDVTPWNGVAADCVVTAETRSTTTEYLSSNGSGDGIFVRFFTDAMGNKMERVYHPQLGVLRGEADPAQLWTTYQFDGFGRLRRTNHPDGSYEAIDYGDSSSTDCSSFAQCTKTTTSAGGFSQVNVDKLGQVLRVITRGPVTASYPTGQKIYSDAHYDQLGRAAASKRPYYQGASQYYASTNTYDSLGRPRRTCVLTQGQPAGTVPTAGTSGTACARNDYTRGETIVYEENGTSVGVIRSAKNLNAAGQLASSTTYPNGFAAPLTTSYAYGPFDTLISVTDPKSNVVTMTYDALGRTERILDLDLGVASDALGSFSRKTTYSGFDEPISVRDAKGQLTTVVYDKAGRVVQRIAPDGTDTFTFDTVLKGRLASRSRGSVSTSFGYQSSTGLLTGETWTIDGTSYAYGYTYYPSSSGSPGKLKSILYPAVSTWQLAVDHLYDQNGYLVQIRDITSPSSPKTVWKPTVIDAEGQVRQETLGNLLNTDTTYDPATGRLTRITTPGIHDVGYSYNPNGTLASRTDYRNSMTNAAVTRTESFTYDGANRLKTAEVLGREYPKFTYTYDELGNLLWADDQEACTNYIYGGSGKGPHQLVAATCWGGPSSVAYDGNGNEIATLAPDFREQDWTSFDKVLEARSRHGRMRYTYDAEHRRVKKEVVAGALAGMPAPQLPRANDGLSGVWDKTLYIGDLYERRSISDTTRTEHVFQIRVGDAPVAQVIRSSTGTTDWRYLHKDYQGSVERTTDAAGVLKEMTSFDAWGVRRSPDWFSFAATYTQDTRIGYTGHRQDDEFSGSAFGVVDMGGRTYDTFFKRFTSPDPIVQDPFYGPSWNRYSYVFNSPTNATDPTGHMTNVSFQQSNLAWYGVDGLVDNMTASGQRLHTFVILDRHGKVIFAAMGPWAEAAVQAKAANHQYARVLVDWARSQMLAAEDTPQGALQEPADGTATGAAGGASGFGVLGISPGIVLGVQKAVEARFFGHYEILFQRGKQFLWYLGKGDPARALVSAYQHAVNGWRVVEIRTGQTQTEAKAYLNEDEAIKATGGAKSPRNMNLIESKGAGIRKALGKAAGRLRAFGPGVGLIPGIIYRIKNPYPESMGFWDRINDDLHRFSGDLDPPAPAHECGPNETVGCIL